MSALTYRTGLLAQRRLATTRLIPTLTRAAFTTSSPHAKSAVDAAADALHSVDRKISDKIVDGINISSTAPFTTRLPAPFVIYTRKHNLHRPFRAHTC
jgi:hypothetical protein